MRRHLVINGQKELLHHYHTLEKGDIIKGRLSLRQSEEHLLLDLMDRGIQLIPSATAQLASKSKAFQARIFKKWMLPDTQVMYDSHQVLESINHYNSKQVGKVIVKVEGKNAGIGILQYNSIEDVYTHAANRILSFPFVLQPYLSGCTDIRVIIIDDYVEAYSRTNPYSFRNNLHCGGNATPVTLKKDELQFCYEIMKRGQFHYGHLDLLLTQEQKLYLAEINLRGGIRGAQIKTEEYKRLVMEAETRLLEKLKRE